MTIVKNRTNVLLLLLVGFMLCLGMPMVPASTDAATKKLPRTSFTGVSVGDEFIWEVSGKYWEDQKIEKVKIKITTSTDTVDPGTITAMYTDGTCATHHGGPTYLVEVKYDLEAWESYVNSYAYYYYDSGTFGGKSVTLIVLDQGMMYNGAAGTCGTYYEKYDTETGVLCEAKIGECPADTQVGQNAGGSYVELYTYYKLISWNGNDWTCGSSSDTDDSDDSSSGGGSTGGGSTGTTEGWLNPDLSSSTSSIPGFDLLILLPVAVASLVYLALKMRKKHVLLN